MLIRLWEEQRILRTGMMILFSPTRDGTVDMCLFVHVLTLDYRETAKDVRTRTHKV